MDKTNPFHMPEIITLIGRCLPLWKYSERLGFYDFNPKILLRCTLVNKTWYDALVPLIWYVYNGYVMRSIPKDIIVKNSRYFRIFFYDRGFSGPFLSQNLKGLVISWWDGALLPLVEANAGSLENLCWKGSTSPSPMRSITLPSLDYDLFLRMAPTLEQLQLSHWTLSGCEFVRFLSACKRLHDVSLAAIEWIDSDPSDPLLLAANSPTSYSSPSSYSSSSASPSSPSSSPLPAPLSRAYPCRTIQGLKDLRLDISVSRKGAFVDLVRSCPNLENFSLYSESAEDARTLIPILREYCSCKLQGIEYVTRFSSVLDGYDYLTDHEYSEMVLCGQSIKSLKMDIPQLDDVMTRALILQASSLRSLSLRFLRRRAIPMQDAENLCRILKHCIRLQDLSLVFSPHSLGKDETLRLFEEPWNCVELETLELTDVIMVTTTTTIDHHSFVDAEVGMASTAAAAVAAGAGGMYQNIDPNILAQRPYQWRPTSASSLHPGAGPSAGSGGVQYGSVTKQRLFDQVRKLRKLTRLSLNHVTYSVDGFCEG